MTETEDRPPERVYTFTTVHRQGLEDPPRQRSIEIPYTIVVIGEGIDSTRSAGWVRGAAPENGVAVGVRLERVHTEDESLGVEYEVAA